MVDGFRLWPATTAGLGGTNVGFSQEANHRARKVADAMNCRRSDLPFHRLCPAMTRPPPTTGIGYSIKPPACGAAPRCLRSLSEHQPWFDPGVCRARFARVFDPVLVNANPAVGRVLRA